MVRRVPSIALVLPALAFFAGCSESSDRTIAPAANPAIADSASVSLYTAASTSLTVGQTVPATQLSGLARYLTAKGLAYTISTTRSTVLSVNNTTKYVTGVAAGTASLIVKGVRELDTIPVVVGTSTTYTLVLSAPATSLAVGSTVQLSLVAKSNLGTLVTSPIVTYSSTNTAVLAVNSTGLVKGIGAGTAQIKVTGLGTSAAITLTVTSSVSTPSAPSGPLPALGTGVALPLQPTLLNFSYPAVTGKQYLVSTAAAFQGALNNAQRGDEIVLQAGVSYVGNFTMPAKSGTAANGWIVIRSSALSSLPAGVRVSKSSAAYMPKILSPNATPALYTLAGTSGWWLAGLEIGLTSSSWINYGLLNLGDGSGAQNTLAQVPSDIVVDRNYIHATSTQPVSRCIGLNSARTEIRDSYLHECHGQGFDAQAIGGWNGPGPYRIYNNMLAGSGENVMFGGADPAISGLVPSDIEIRRNYLYTPASWKGVWSKKNIFELKNARRVLAEGNVFDGSWLDAQVGFGIMIYSTNQSGGCRWCRVTDVMFRANEIRNVAGGVNISGRQTSNADTVTSRVAFISNVIQNVIYPTNNILIQVLSNGKDLTVDSLVAVGSGGTVREFLVLDPRPAWTNMRFSNAVVEHGQYGLFSSYYPAGEASLADLAGNKIYGNVWIIGAQNGAYPTSTFISSEGLAPLSSSVRGRVAAATAGVAIP